MKNLRTASAFALAAACAWSAPLRADAARAPSAVAEIASFSRLQQDTTALAMAIGQPALSLALLKAGSLLASPGLLGIDRERPIRLAIFPNDDDPLAVFAVPLAEPDGASYLRSVEAAAEKTGESGDYRTYSLSDSPLGETLQLVVADGWAYLSPDDALPEDELRAIAAQGSDALAVTGVRGTFRLSVPSASCAGRVRELALLIAREIPADTDPGRRLRATGARVLELLAQTDRFAFGLDYAADRGLTLWSRTDARPGSDAAALLRGTHAPDPAVLALLDAGQDDSFGGALGIDPALLRRLADAYIDAIDVFTAKFGDSAASPVLPAVHNLLPLCRKATAQMEHLSGSFAEAGSFGDDNLPSVRQAFGCSNRDALRRSSESLLGTLADTEFGAAIHVEELPARESDGIAIDRARVSIDTNVLLSLVAPDGIGELPDSAAAEFAKTFERFAAFSSRTLESAFRDGIEYTAWAPGDTPLDPVLAPASPAPASPAARLAALFPDVPELPDAFLREFVDYATIIPLGLRAQAGALLVDPADEELAALLERIGASPAYLGSLAWRDADSLLAAVRVDEAVFRAVAAIAEFAVGKFRDALPDDFPAPDGDDDDEDDDDEDDDADDDDADDDAEDTP